MSNSLDPTRGARCCRERVLLCPFPTQGQSASSPNPAVNRDLREKPRTPVTSTLNDSFPQSSTAATGRAETVVGGLSRGCVGPALEVSARPEVTIGRPLQIAAIQARRYALRLCAAWVASPQYAVPRTDEKMKSSTPQLRYLRETLTIKEIKTPEVVENLTLRNLAEKAKSARSREFIAEQYGCEAGFLCYEDWSDRSSGFIYELFVLPEWRNRGIGSCLLSYSENLATSLGCNLIQLAPYAFDKTLSLDCLISFYERKGFSENLGDPSKMQKTLLSM